METKPLEKLIDKIEKSNFILKRLLDICDSANIQLVTFKTHQFFVEYELSSDDKDYVTFHKNADSPLICDELMVCDVETTLEPIYKDWYMSINYHS